jgi:hypothetical protein
MFKSASLNLVALRSGIRAADSPRYGWRTRVDLDPDFREFMFGLTGSSPSARSGSNPRQLAADEPTLATQGD